MAKKIKRKTERTVKKDFISPFRIYWEKENYYFLAAGIVVVILGFYFLSIGPWDSFSSLVIAPVLLFIGYVIIFPASILFRKKFSHPKSQEDDIAAGKS